MFQLTGFFFSAGLRWKFCRKKIFKIQCIFCIRGKPCTLSAGICGKQCNHCLSAAYKCSDVCTRPLLRAVTTDSSIQSCALNSSERFTEQTGDDWQQARPSSDLQHSLVHQTHLLLVVLQELAQGYGLQHKSPLSLTFTAVHRQCVRKTWALIGA